MDTVSKERRAEIMSLVRGKDTRPELMVRHIVYAMGHRYRLHRRDIPGVPDLAFIGRRKVVFVHGCFWHGHPACPNTRMPKSNVRFWRADGACWRCGDPRRRCGLFRFPAGRPAFRE